MFPGPATVSGWGRVETNGTWTSWLNHVAVTIFRNGDCGGDYPTWPEGYLCAGAKEGGKGLCQGDSGGPLVASDPRRNGALSLAGVVRKEFQIIS